MNEPSHPTPLTEREKQMLLNQWNNASETLMQRDGRNYDFKDGGHNIKNNPLLTAAILEIRNGYFQNFTEKKHWIRLQKESPNPSIKTKLEDLDYDLIMHNKESAERLQKPLYGFSHKQAYEITGNNEPEPLSKKDANSIIGTIIKRTINAFEITFARNKIPRMGVPHISPTKSPEQTGRHRSEPKKDWVKRTEEPTTEIKKHPFL